MIGIEGSLVHSGPAYGPPFLGLHLVFNVDLLRPYFPPLLDISEVAELLTPTELNPECLEQATMD